MDSKQPEKWLGGYVRQGKKGPAYIIERWINGTRYHVSTKCRTQRAALKQLEIFEADPPNYRPTRAVQAARVEPKRITFTADLILEYERWMTTRAERPTTIAHARAHAHCLERWMVFYDGRDVRTVTLRELSEDIESKPNQAMRIQCLKAFFGWLRAKKFLLTRNEDPTLDLHQPAARAAKDAGQVAIEPERIRAILPHLPEITRDVMILRLGTGWHMSEVMRFAKEGVIRLTPGKFVRLITEDGAEKVPLLATLQVRQKIGVKTNTPILYEEHLEAAKRIRARGRIYSYFTLNRHVTDACAKAGVPRFLNWHIRHSVVSNAIEAGADLKDASVFVDHLSIDTTRRHYAQIALPKKAVPVLRVVGDDS